MVTLVVDDNSLVVMVVAVVMLVVMMVTLMVVMVVREIVATSWRQGFTELLQQPSAGFVWICYTLKKTKQLRTRRLYIFCAILMT